MSDEKKPVNYNYPANSKKSKEEAAKPEEKQTEEKVIKKVTTTAKVRKQPLGKRLVETLTGDDAHSVGQYVLFEVMLPAFKNMVADAVSTGVERMMFGDSRGRRGSGSSYSSGSRSTYTAYNRYSSSSSRRDDRDRDRTPVRRARHGHEEIITETKEDAGEILDQMVDLIERFDVATVSDLYGMINKTPQYTDEKYGWTNTEIRHAEIRRIRDGWLLDLPSPEYID